MPFRLDPDRFPNRAKIQFTTSAAMKHQIYTACLATGIVSNTVYCQRALCEALSRDLDIDLETLLADMPAPRGPAGHLYDPAEQTMNRFLYRTKTISRIGPADTIEEVR